MCYLTTYWNNEYLRTANRNILWMSLLIYQRLYIWRRSLGYLRVNFTEAANFCFSP